MKNTRFPTIQKWLEALFPNEQDHAFIMKYLQKRPRGDDVLTYPKYICQVKNRFNPERLFRCFVECVSEFRDTYQEANDQGGCAWMKIHLSVPQKLPDIKKLLEELPAFKSYLDLPDTVIV